MVTSRFLKYSIVLLLLVVIVKVYSVYHPLDNNIFPKCPFRETTGLMCPGCGSQRAMHYLFNFNVLKAINANALLVISIPYILTGLFFDSVKMPGTGMLKWRRIIYGKNAIVIVLSLIFMFWILRNVITIDI